MKHSISHALSALALGLLAGAPLATGCTVPSLYGFDNPEIYEFEPDLLGVWAQPGEEDAAYILTAGEKNTFDVLMVETRDDKEERLHLTAAMVRIDGHLVVDVTLAQEALEEVTGHYGTLLIPTHQFFRLEPVKEGMMVHMLDDEWIGSWPGVLKLDDMPVLATGSPALLRILAAAVQDKDAWDHSFVLEKKKDGR